MFNWGDRLNWTILTSLDASPAWREPADADLVLVGSVLEHLPAGWSGTVAGAGKLHEHSTVDLSNAKVLAVRGHLTAKSVKGVPADVVVGDPALLVPQWIRQWPAKHDLGVIPHWSDTTLRDRFPHGHFIDPTGRPEDVVAEIAKCKRVVSSSLHGLIVADAYGIPRRAELFPQAVREGGDFKFRDYCSIYGETPHWGEFWLAPHEVVKRVQDELREVLEVAVGRQRPPKPVPAPCVEPWIKTPHGNRCPQISLLVPFRDDGEHRSRVWSWLRRYWYENLDSVEIIQGHDGSFPFNKAQAVNRAAEQAKGRVFVILDADAYMDADVIQHCADSIDKAVKAGRRQWFMPYDKLYRLNRFTTYNLLYTDPHKPYVVESPPPPNWLEQSSPHSYGHQYGAMVQIMPREAFFLVGGMDPRFNQGWGSEDGSMLRALDTLYAQHENTRNDVLHMWHARPGDGWSSRRWVGQQWTPANARLAQRYAHATGEPGYMRQLCNEHHPPKPQPPCKERRKCRFKWW